MRTHGERCSYEADIYEAEGNGTNNEGNVTQNEALRAMEREIGEERFQHLKIMVALAEERQLRQRIMAELGEERKRRLRSEAERDELKRQIEATFEATPPPAKKATLLEGLREATQMTEDELEATVFGDGGAGMRLLCLLRDHRRRKLLVQGDAS